MNRVPVQSSHLKSVGYDPATSRMHVEFANGALYEYDRVTPQEHSDLMGSESMGRHFHTKFEGRMTGKKLSR